MLSSSTGIVYSLWSRISCVSLWMGCKVQAEELHQTSLSGVHIPFHESSTKMYFLLFIDFSYPKRSEIEGFSSHSCIQFPLPFLIVGCMQSHMAY